MRRLTISFSYVVCSFCDVLDIDTSCCVVAVVFFAVYVYVYDDVVQFICRRRVGTHDQDLTRTLTNVKRAAVCQLQLFSPLPWLLGTI